MCLGPGLSEEEDRSFINSVPNEKRVFWGDVNILAALRNERAKGFEGRVHFATAWPAPPEHRPCRDASVKGEKEGRKKRNRRHSRRNGRFGAWNAGAAARLHPAPLRHRRCSQPSPTSNTTTTKKNPHSYCKERGERNKKKKRTKKKKTRKKF